MMTMTSSPAAEAPEPLLQLGLEDQPGLGGAFVGLPGSQSKIGQRGPTLPMAFTAKLVTPLLLLAFNPLRVPFPLSATTTPTQQR